MIRYDVEIWGRSERKRMDKMQERYARWFLGVDWETPGYIEREELNGINRIENSEKGMEI